jgi:hypothetical protein
MDIFKGIEASWVDGQQVECFDFQWDKGEGGWRGFAPLGCSPSSLISFAIEIVSQMRSIVQQRRLPDRNSSCRLQRTRLGTRDLSAFFL